MTRTRTRGSPRSDVIVLLSHHVTRAQILNSMFRGGELLVTLRLPTERYLHDNDGGCYDNEPISLLPIDSKG